MKKEKNTENIKNLYIKHGTGKNQREQLLKLNRFPHLDKVLRDNIHQIDIPEKDLFFTDEEYKDILKKNNMNEDIPYLPIWYDSTRIFCVIRPIAKELKDELIEDLKT